jgi:tetratricopeptide (TPR) repeat protein
LFSVAETYAFTRLSDDQLDPQRRSELVIELSRTYAEHAAFAGAQRDDFWQKARSILEDELARVPPPRRSGLLRAQLAFNTAVRAEVLYRDAQVQPENGALQSAARDAAEPAIAALEQLIETHQNALKSNTALADDLAAHERRHLLQAAQLELGHTFRRRAELTPRGSQDRVADVIDAEQAYRQAIQLGLLDLYRIGRAKLGLVECARLQRDFDLAREMLKKIVSHEPPLPAELADEIDACRVRMLLDEGRGVEAAQHLIAVRQTRPRMSGELWFLQLQMLLQLRTTAEQKQDHELAAKLRSEAEVVLARVDEHVGGWWSRYCRQLWAREQSREELGAELDQLVRRARGEYADGKPDVAAATYAEAAQLAFAREQTDLGVELSFTRGSILLELNQFDAAAQELAQLADRQPQHERTPAAHVWAAYALGRLYDAEKTKSRREAYTDALEAHLARFPESPTTGDARIMLGRLEEQRLQTTRALPLYLAIAADHPRGLDATVSAARCYQSLIARMKPQQLDWQPLQREARETIASRLQHLAADPAQWSIGQSEAVTALVRIVLLSAPPDFRAADQQLERLQTAVAAHRPGGGDPESAPWTALASQLLPLRLLALAGTGRNETARKLLAQIPADDVPRLWAAVKGLDQLAAGEPAGNIVELTELCVAAVMRMEPHRARLPAAERWDFDVARVRAYVSTGRIEQGLPIAQQMASASAKELDRQRALATVLQQSSAAEAQKLARTCWRRVENGTPAGSPDWLIARAEVIRCYLALGERKDALTMWTATRLLHPESDDPAIRQRYAALEKEFTSSPKR